MNEHEAQELALEPAEAAVRAMLQLCSSFGEQVPQTAAYQQAFEQAYASLADCPNRACTILVDEDLRHHLQPYLREETFVVFVQDGPGGIGIHRFDNWQSYVRGQAGQNR